MSACELCGFDAEHAQNLWDVLRDRCEKAEAELAALKERVESLEYAKAACWQVIQAKTYRIAELEKSIIERAQREELLKSELRERDE